MRTARVRGPENRPSTYYHVMSRTLAELGYWSAVEKEKMRELIGKLLAFSGLCLVTFCVMGNHIHLLVEVPSERESLRAMSDDALLDCLEILYSADVVQRTGWQLQAFRESGLEAEALALRERYLARMHDLSAFMAELKQRFSQFYNARRAPTAWGGPPHSHRVISPARRPSVSHDLSLGKKLSPIPPERMSNLFGLTPYSLSRDPNQTNDLATYEPERLEQGKKQLLEINARLLSAGADWQASNPQRVLR